MACKKKLYKLRPKDKKQEVELHFSKNVTEIQTVTPITVERDVRQMLADKISGNYVGLWLLIPEHLRLGTWDMLKAWSGIHAPNALEPRLSMQLIHEAALCINGVRARRTLRQKGFETLNGLPFVATDKQIHKLLDEHTIADAKTLQFCLGKMRRLCGHFPGRFIIFDPHRIKSKSKRQMRLMKSNNSEKASKTLQSFFALDAESRQPIVCSIGSSATTATQASIALVKQLTDIIPDPALLLLDKEHFTTGLITYLMQHQKLTFLMPAPRYKNIMSEIEKLRFTPQWAGYAVAETTYSVQGLDEPIRSLMQRTGEIEEDYHYQPFITSSRLPADELMALVFPERWNIEEFFKSESALGWNRASTFNLNIRFGKLSHALIAQAALYQLRQKLPGDMSTWTAQSLAEKFFGGIDGDIRVRKDTIVVTMYNAPNAPFFKEQYENLPAKLEAEGINPRVPWLYDFKVDFRFK